MVEQGKGTRMGHAVNSMIQYINRPSSGRRPDVPLHIVAITDGNSFDDITEPGSRSGFKNKKVVIRGDFAQNYQSHHRSSFV